MTVIYGGVILIGIVAGILYIASRGRPAIRPKGNTNGSDSVTYVSHTHRDEDGRWGSDAGDGGHGGTDGGSSGGGDGGGGGGD